MEIDNVITILGLVVSKYFAAFCIISILFWSTWSYLMHSKWQQILRDSAVYFLTISFLSVILALRPVNADVDYWTPVSWFSFSMLFIMELLWLSYLVESLLQFITHISFHKSPKHGIMPDKSSRIINTPYARK